MAEYVLLQLIWLKIILTKTAAAAVLGMAGCLIAAKADIMFVLMAQSARLAGVNSNYNIAISLLNIGNKEISE